MSEFMLTRRRAASIAIRRWVSGIELEDTQVALVFDHGFTPILLSYSADSRIRSRRWTAESIESSAMYAMAASNSRRAPSLQTTRRRPAPISAGVVPQPPRGG